MEALTRKYGPLPGWAWAGLAVAAGLVFWYLRGRSSQNSSSPGGSLVNNPAASTVPYVPSVTVTGIPTGTQTPSTPAASTGTAVTAGSGNPNLAGPPYSGRWIPLYNATGGQVGQVPTGTKLNVTGSAIPFSLGSLLPVDYLGGGLYVSAADVTPAGSGGQGGWGYAGGVAPAGALGGWTVGWFPTAAAGPGYAVAGGQGGSGGPSAVNRTRTTRGRLTPRFLAGGQGGGKATRPARTRPLRRRDFSTRR